MNCETIQEYLDRYGPLVADRARQAFEPLHVPSTDAVVTLDLKRPMLPAQGHVVTAAVKTLKRQKAVFLCCECGTGKSQMGACAVHAHAAGKPYRAIVMCPPHLVETWRAELQHVFHEGTVGSPRPGIVAGVAHLSSRKADEADLAHHGRDDREERPLLAGRRREGPPGSASLPRLRSPVAEQGQRRGRLPHHAGPGTLPEDLYGRDRRRPRSRRQPDRPALRCRLVAVCRQACRLGTRRLHPPPHEGRVRLSHRRRDSRGEERHFRPCQRSRGPGRLLQARSSA